MAMDSVMDRPIDQIGYLVADMDASIERWITHMGVGPWTVFRNVALEGRYRGERCAVTMDVGLAYQGEIQIELIKITNHEPSPYRDKTGHSIVGIHHVAWVVDDLDAAVARATARGLTIAFEAANSVTRVAYLESLDEPGVLLEFIEGAGMREMIQSGITATRDWNGRNPVQSFDMG